MELSTRKETGNERERDTQKLNEYDLSK